MTNLLLGLYRGVGLNLVTIRDHCYCSRPRAVAPCPPGSLGRGPPLRAAWPPRGSPPTSGGLVASSLELRHSDKAQSNRPTWNVRTVWALLVHGREFRPNYVPPQLAA